MASPFPSRVSVFEVAPRDGLQNESVVIPTDQKIALIDRLSDAGFEDIEVGSFVSPKWIPQLADTREVLAGITRRPGVRYWTLVPNPRGFQDAVAEGAECIAVFMSSSETHNRKNVNRSIAQSLEELSQIIADGRARGMRVRAYLSTVFGCPDEGFVDPERVLSLSKSLLEAGAHQISLGDTIGVANPVQVKDMVARLTAVVPLERIALHFHDTRGTALANVLAGLEAGVTVFDASLGGVGGCPYAPGAAGNLAMEDLLFMLKGMGIETGVDLERAAQTGVFLSELIGRKLPGRYHNYHIGQSRRQAEKAELAVPPQSGG